MVKSNSIGILCAVSEDSDVLASSLESVFSQTNVSFKVYLGIKESCEKALKAGEKLKDRHKESVCLTVMDKALNEAQMLKNMLPESREKYIVFLPAGDVFTDEICLSKQFAMLEKHPDATGVFCLAKDERDGTVIPYDISIFRNNEHGRLYSKHFAGYSMTAYSAVMVRSGELEIPEWYTECSDAYYPLILMMMGKAKLCMNDEIMVEKRTAPTLFPVEGYSKNRIEMLKNLGKYFRKNYATYCSKTIKKALKREVTFALTALCDGSNVKEFFKEICSSQDDKYKWLRDAIEECAMEEKHTQLTGNLHKEWCLYKGLPMVTVVCITYAHEKFIAEALDSFLMQKTNFKYQIFVGEDKGPDGTADIIREYAAKYPDKIVPFIREKNMGAQRNLIDMCRRAKTPYIAFCEGDDYWIDEYKLQKQFDYMESHPTLRSCFHDAEIKDELEEAWFLSEQFENNSFEENGGKMIWPRTMKGFKPRNTYNAGAYIKNGFVHTSSMFYRWDYNAEIPEWYYKHQLGDFSMWLIQLGTGRFGYISEVMSVYRRHEGGAYYFNNKTDYMLKTRSDWIALLRDLRQYFAEHFYYYKVDDIQKRINREINNLFYYIVANFDYDIFLKTVKEIGEESYDVVRWVYSTRAAYKRKKMSKTLEWYFEENPRAEEKLEAKVERIKRRREIFDSIKRIFNYWRYTFCKKDKSTWVFSGFWGHSYMDNTMYMFEHLNKTHPEINAVWISNDQDVVDEVTKKGFKACLDGTKEAVKAMKKAYVGFVDHYVMSDFGDFKGFNYRLKIAQLWHGVGNKRMADVVELSTVKGSQLSPDIIAKSSDSLFKKIGKYLRKIRKAPVRELFERYLMYVCPGREMIEDCHSALKIPEKNFFLCGYPRTAQLSDDLPLPKKKKVIFAPTYRWSKSLENRMVKNLVESFPVIQKTMEEIDARFVIRFHPHTWRDYGYRINSQINKYNRIVIDDTADIYEKMSDYFCMISDYSSIAYDFLLMNRPLVFHCPDLEVYVNADNDLKYDYEKVSPGPKTSSWEETMKAVAEYSENPGKDSEERLKVRDFFYDMSVNDSNNSERITKEVKRRIGLK